MITEATLVLAITKARALLKEAELASKIRIELDNFIEPEGEK